MYYVCLRAWTDLKDCISIQTCLHPINIITLTIKHDGACCLVHAGTHLILKKCSHLNLVAPSVRQGRRRRAAKAIRYVIDFVLYALNDKSLPFVHTLSV